MGEEIIAFTVGQAVDFNALGKEAQVNVRPPNGQPWVVKGIKRNPSPSAPHPQLIDLGNDYPIGPVSGMFLEPKE